VKRILVALAVIGVCGLILWGINTKGSSSLNTAMNIEDSGLDMSTIDKIRSQLSLRNSDSNKVNIIVNGKAYIINVPKSEEKSTAFINPNCPESVCASEQETINKICFQSNIPAGTPIPIYNPSNGEVCYCYCK